MLRQTCKIISSKLIREIKMVTRFCKASRMRWTSRAKRIIQMRWLEILTQKRKSKVRLKGLGKSCLQPIWTDKLAGLIRDNCRMWQGKWREIWDKESLTRTAVGLLEITKMAIIMLESRVCIVRWFSRPLRSLKRESLSICFVSVNQFSPISFFSWFLRC